MNHRGLNGLGSGRGRGVADHFVGGGGVEFLGDGLPVVHLVEVVAAAVEFGPEVGGGFLGVGAGDSGLGFEEEGFGFVVAVKGHENAGTDGEDGGFIRGGFEAAGAEGVCFIQVFFTADVDVGDGEPRVDGGDQERRFGRGLLEHGAGGRLDFAPFSLISQGCERVEGVHESGTRIFPGEEVKQLATIVAQGRSVPMRISGDEVDDEEIDIAEEEADGEGRSGW